ncbi:MAG: SDR family oxidoreductase [Rubrivivax sp.]
MKVDGRVVVVTGAGSGIGAALAQRFAAEGAAAVVVTDRYGDAAVAVAATCVGAEGRCVGHALALDVSDGAALDAAIDDIERRLGPIGLFASNAGLGARGGAEVDDAAWQQLWDVHVMAAVHAARVLVPRWTARGGGWLLITASAAGLLSQPDAPYAVTKHAAVALAEWLAIRHGGQGVGVSCLCPGAVDTPLLRAEPPGRLAAMASGQAPLSPAEVAGIVVQGLADERFLIVTDARVPDWMQRKSADVERWIRGMRRTWAGS